MSSYKMVQMVLRGFVILLMAIGLFLNSESHHPSRTGSFCQTGVFGSCLFVSAGLMIEAGLQMSYSDTFVESFIIILGIVLNIIAGIFAFYEFYEDKTSVSPEIKINKGFIALMTIGIYMIDVCLIFFRG